MQKLFKHYRDTGAGRSSGGANGEMVVFGQSMKGCWVEVKRSNDKMVKIEFKQNY